MGITIRTGALINAMGQAGVFLKPVWLTNPTATIIVGAAITLSGGTATGLPVPAQSASITVNGVSKPWPYVPQAADSGLPYVITPIATALGVSVNATPIVGTFPAYTPFFPTMAIGQNAPLDTAFTKIRIFNDRILAGEFFADKPCTVTYPLASQDATTGLPTTAFAIKLAEGVLANSPTVTGQWCLNYAAPAQRAIQFVNSSTGSLISHTFSGGVGQMIFSYTAGSAALGVYFSDGGVTALSCYDPTTYATWSTGGTPALFAAEYLATTPQYAYLRTMDLSNANGDYANATSWTLDSVAWSNRISPTNVYFNVNGNETTKNGVKAGVPIEWLVALSNAAGKPGWFNIPELATDDYITQYATYIAQNLSAGLTADFELGNEAWNTSGGFLCYRKAGYSAMNEVLAFQSHATTEWNKTYRGGAFISTFASDGTTATLVFSGGHGQTVGATTFIPKIVGANSGYTNFGGTNNATVVDANTITYPTTQASTGGAISAATVLASSGFLALNGNEGFFNGKTDWGSIYDTSYYWHWRRAFQMAALVKAAFAAVGRQASDCRPVLAIQASSGNAAQWFFGAREIILYFAGQFPGVKMSDRLKAVAVGGYLALDQGMPAFGLNATRTTPQTTSDVLNQMQQVADVAYAVSSYGCTASWVRDQGLELWGYEVGIDTVGAGGQSTTTQNACTAANGDPGMTPIITEWVQAFRKMGFTRLGWYQCGAGGYGGTGCFNLGQSAAEITASTDPSLQSAKYKGLMAATTPWTTAPTRHVYPCTLSGCDVVGNEAVVLPGGALKPSLSGANINTTGQGSTYTGVTGGLTFYVWLESATQQTVGVTLFGDYTAAGATTITAQPLNGSTSGSGQFTMTGTKSNTTLGTCNVTLQPGPNYVLIGASANSANVFLDVSTGVQFM